MWCRKYQRRGLGWLIPWTQGEKRKEKKQKTVKKPRQTWTLAPAGMGICQKRIAAAFFHSAKGNRPAPCRCNAPTIPFPLFFITASHRCVSPGTDSAAQPGRSALATAFAFSLRWQRYRRTAVENNGYYQSESDVFFDWQNAQGWLWALPAMRFELPAKPAFKFSLIPAQLLIGNSSHLTNSIGMAQLLPNAKSYCCKTFAFALLVVIQSML